MEKLYQEYKDNNLYRLGGRRKDRKQDAVDFVKELKITYPIALDPEAQIGSLYGAWGLPPLIIIGPKGEGLARGGDRRNGMATGRETDQRSDRRQTMTDVNVFVAFAAGIFCFFLPVSCR